MAGYALGVDLGTTWTAAAIARPGSEPQVVSLGGRTAAVPTVVHIAADGTVNVGDAAERRAVTDPDRVAREFKRRLGDTTPVLLGGQPWSPESLLAGVLRWVVGRVSELEGDAPSSVVVTHPANWGPLRRELLEQAVAHLGLAVRFVAEPEAAAVHYASATRVPEGTLIGVYDLGGGTFDATVLRKSPDGFEVLGQPGGVERLGGLDFDAAVLAHVTGILGAAWTGLDPTDPATRAAVLRLRADCVLAKEALSEDADASIGVALPSVATEVRLTRAEFESMIRPAIEQSADAFERAVAAAGVAVAHLDRILLVGGSSRIPLVSQVLATRFGRPLALDTHPKHAVALGAARLALAGPQPVVPTAPVAPPAAPAAPAWSPTPVAADVLPEPEPAMVRRRFPVWIPIVAVVAVIGVAAAFALGGGGGGDDPPGEEFGRSGDEEFTPFFDPEVVQTLDGSWFYSGFATACEGLADEDCDAFADDFTVDLSFSCDGSSCEVAVGASDPQFLGDDGSGLFAEGPLSDDDGFQCDGEPDPTSFQLFITDIDTDGEDVATSFDAEVTLTSQDGDTDDNSCVFEFVETEGTAERTSDDLVEVSDDTGTITISVPERWGSVGGQEIGFVDSDVVAPDLVVATDEERFVDDLGVAGINVTAFDAAAIAEFGVLGDVAALVAPRIDGFDLESACEEEDEPSDFEIDGYEGTMRYFNGCGGTAGVAVFGGFDTEGRGIIVEAHLVDALDEAVLDEVLATVDIS